MTPKELASGHVINYRGTPALVIECWGSVEEALDNFKAPAGCVIEWEEGGQTHRCRLLWEDPDAQTTDGLNGEPLVLWED